MATSTGVYFDLGHRIKEGEALFSATPSSTSTSVDPPPIRANHYRNRLASPRPRGTHHAPPLLRPLKHLHTMDARERTFLEAAERGDKPTIEECLNPANSVNVNCTDLLGRSAMEIAVDNENGEIVDILLQQPGVKIGNALLYAIREGVYKIVEMLINHPTITKEMLGEEWSSSLEKQQAENFEYPSDISPVMLAAHLNQFEILQLLLSRGATIRRPHNLACSCACCQEERLLDSLHHSLHRIHTYRALASPAWISLTSNDPILSSFRLSWELQKLSVRQHEFKEVYWHLSEQCKTFACDLLSQCRSTEEVIAVLNKDQSDDPDDIWGSKLSLARLKLAIKYEQKQFVSHPHCQQLLTSIWYEGFPGRQERGSSMNIFVCLLLILAWPVLATCYILFPHSRAGQIVRSPFMKFLYYSTSFGCFLLLLTLATFEGYRRNDEGEESRATQRGPPPTFVETLIAIWVFGMVWSEVKQLWEEGFQKYMRQWWNWLDFIMMSLYLSTFCLRAIAYFRMRGDPFDPTFGPSSISRKFWRADEPTLIAEGLFAVANVFSFARIIYLFQTNPYLGPLQISLGCMLVDIAKFFVIFLLILTSFAIGMAQLYWWYRPEWKIPKDDFAFSSIPHSYTTLLWSLFSITDTRATDLDETGAAFTEWIGRGMFIAYHVTSIIVLLNMLIAMMSHSFQIINDHADLEWKFHRTKLWMSYFDEGSSLPAPFNIILTPKSMYYFFRFIFRFIRHCSGQDSAWAIRSKRATIKRPGYEKRKQQLEEHPPSSLPEKLTYQDIMRRLVSRHIHQTKKEMKMDGVNEDDLLEIKQDISSLRFELREDRRKEIARSSTHIDGVKKEILRTLSVTGPKTTGTVPATPASAQTMPPPRLAHSEADAKALTRTPSLMSECDEQDEAEAPSGPSFMLNRRTPSTSAFSFRRRPANVWDLENMKKELVETLTDRISKQVAEMLTERTAKESLHSKFPVGSPSSLNSNSSNRDNSPATAKSPPQPPSYSTAVAIEVPSYMAECVGATSTDPPTASRPPAKFEYLKSLASMPIGKPGPAAINQGHHQSVTGAKQEPIFAFKQDPKPIVGNQKPVDSSSSKVIDRHVDQKQSSESKPISGLAGSKDQSQSATNAPNKKDSNKPGGAVVLHI